MRSVSTRQLGWIWLAALGIFALSAWGATATLPSVPPDRPGASYYIGLVGLLALGAALAFSWRWLRAYAAARASQSPPSPIPVALHLTLGLVLVLATIAWLVAMVFPFL